MVGASSLAARRSTSMPWTSPVPVTARASPVAARRARPSARAGRAAVRRAGWCSAGQPGTGRSRPPPGPRPGTVRRWTGRARRARRARRSDQGRPARCPGASRRPRPRPRAARSTVISMCGRLGSVAPVCRTVSPSGIRAPASSRPETNCDERARVDVDAAAPHRAPHSERQGAAAAVVDPRTERAQRGRAPVPWVGPGPRGRRRTAPSAPSGRRPAAGTASPCRPARSRRGVGCLRVGLAQRRDLDGVAVRSRSSPARRVPPGRPP